MISYTEAYIDTVAVHRIGNKANQEDLLLSKKLLPLDDDRLKSMLMRFFLSSFKSDEYFSFTFSNDDFTLNPLYTYAERVFSSLKTFHADSIDIAKHLYDVSDHPQIKEGDLFVVHFTDIVVVDEIVTCIGIFKSENKHPFLKLNSSGTEFVLNIDEGINVDKLDKGCLIFNTDKEAGYKIAIVDNSSKSQEAQFWRERFLMLKPADDNYHKTKSFLTMAKNFVQKQLPDEYDMAKIDAIDIMNRSKEYFESKDVFNRAEFEDDVLQEAGLINSFRQYDDNYRQNRQVAYLDEFEISPRAVAKQAKMFKQIIKLDRNFHIYIHGDKDQIVQGTERDGRKYYKLYYDEES